MQKQSSTSYLQQSMALSGRFVFDAEDASGFDNLPEYNNDDFLNADFDSQFGTQFEFHDTGLGRSGSYPDLEQDQQHSTCTGPYFTDPSNRQLCSSSERSTQLVIPGRGHPDLVGDIVADLPGFSSNTPSVSDISGDAPTPPSSPRAGQHLIPAKKGYVRSSAVHRRDQECYCPHEDCKNQKFSRQENLDRHNKTKHGHPREQYICRYCAKVSHARLDKARSHWRNIHEKQGRPFEPRTEMRGTAS